MSGYSLWLVPPEPEITVLRAMVSDFARQTGMPAFEPHLTLLGDVPGDPLGLPLALNDTARGIEPIPVTLGRAVFGDRFFMSFYALAVDNPSLSALRETCARMLSVEAGRFTPHVSLAYGDVPAGLQAGFAARAAACLPMTFTLGAISVVRASGETPIKDWTRLAELEFAA